MAMRLDNFWLIVVLLTILLCGWRECGSHKTLTIQNTKPIVQANINKLIIECQTLAREGIAQGKDTWLSQDLLPPTIRSLSPQLVRLRITDSPPTTIIDIQLLGGFKHHGYLIVCAINDLDFVPKKGREWKIIKIAPRVFEYRE